MRRFRYRYKALLLLLLIAFVGTLGVLSLKKDQAPEPAVIFAKADEGAALLRASGERPEHTGRLLIHGTAAPYDRETGTYYVPVSAFGGDLTEGLTFSNKGAAARLIRDGMEEDRALAIESSHAFTLVISDAEAVYTERLVFTGLPIMTIETLSDDSIAARDENNIDRITLFDPSGADGCRVDTYYGKDRLRGSFGRNFSKNSYLISLDEEEENDGIPLLGLRADNKWILLPMHMDQNKLRDKLAQDLWNDFAEADPDACDTGTHMAYIELFRDGRYWGLYGLTERITGESLSLKETDILFKVARKSKHTSEVYGSVKHTLDGGDSDTEIHWPEIYTGEALWDPMIHYVKSFIEDPEDYSPEELYEQLDLKNAVDYTIYYLTVAAEDNCIHNTYYLFQGMPDGGTRLRRIPWDLTITFGYRNFLSDNASGFDPAELERINPPTSMIHLMERDPEGFFTLLSERYRTLRKRFLTPEHLLENLAIQSNRIKKSGAMKREIERWTVVENTEDTTELEAFIQDRFAVLDDYFLTPYSAEKLERIG